MHDGEHLCTKTQTGIGIGSASVNNKDNSREKHMSRRKRQQDNIFGKEVFSVCFLFIQALFADDNTTKTVYGATTCISSISTCNILLYK